MIELTHRPTVDEFLSLPECSGFWRETGGAVPLPSFFRFLYESGCMVILEPFGGFIGVHIACLKKYRHNAASFLIKCFEYIKSIIEGIRIVARIESDRPNVIKLAKRAGMKEYSKSSTHLFLEVI